MGEFFRLHANAGIPHLEAQIRMIGAVPRQGHLEVDLAMLVFPLGLELDRTVPFLVHHRIAFPADPLILRLIQIERPATLANELLFGMPRHRLHGPVDPQVLPLPIHANADWNGSQNVLHLGVAGQRLHLLP